MFFEEEIMEEENLQTTFQKNDFSISKENLESITKFIDEKPKIAGSAITAIGIELTIFGIVTWCKQ